MVHETWTFGPYVRQKWVLKVDWPNLQPIPNDASQETLDFPTVFANDISDPDDVGMLTLRTLLETDWKACQHSYADQEELQTAREEIIQKLSPLGGLDDVRLFFGVNY